MIPVASVEKFRLSLRGRYLNKVLRGIFGHKRHDIPGEWKKLYDEERQADLNSRAV